MKISELQEIEKEQLELLQERSRKGDNEATAVLLAHLRCISKDITEWQEKKQAREKK